MLVVKSMGEGVPLAARARVRAKALRPKKDRAGRKERFSWYMSPIKARLQSLPRRYKRAIRND